MSEYYIQWNLDLRAFSVVRKIALISGFHIYLVHDLNNPLDVGQAFENGMVGPTIWTIHYQYSLKWDFFATFVHPNSQFGSTQNSHCTKVHIFEKL